MTNKEKIEHFYNTSSKENMTLVDEFYHENIEFQDPVGKIHGRIKMKEYYVNLYENVKAIKFNFSNFIEDKNTVVAVWTMVLETEKLKGGDPIHVDGNSVIVFNEAGQAITHRDYFDMGEFIYEHIPVLGFAVRKVRERLKH